MTRVPDARTIIDRGASEDDFLTLVGETLTACGWRWVHHRRSDRHGGVLMGDKGFPDIVAVRPGKAADELLFIELKADNGRLSRDQEAWLADLAVIADASCDGDHSIHVHVWRPRDWPAVKKILAR